jgi:hypothetical protein
MLLAARSWLLAKANASSCGKKLGASSQQLEAENFSFYPQVEPIALLLADRSRV